MKSAKADEIFGFASDEIKSTHPPSRRISSNEVGFHRQRRFHPPARVDLFEKSTDKVDAFFWRRRREVLPLCGYALLALPHHTSQKGFCSYSATPATRSPPFISHCERSAHSLSCRYPALGSNLSQAKRKATRLGCFSFWKGSMK